jgi:hypothetical protein
LTPGAGILDADTVAGTIVDTALLLQCAGLVVGAVAVGAMDMSVCAIVQVDLDGAYWLRLPPLARLRTDESLRKSGELAQRFGGQTTTSARGRINVYQEVRPQLLTSGKLSAGDMEFLKMRCEEILEEAGIIHKESNLWKDSHGQSWTFPTECQSDRQGSCCP